MIKVNELRIGNWLMYNRGYKKVASVYNTNNVCFEYDYKLKEGTIKGIKKPFELILRSIEAIQSIPLTEEILLKCGFEKFGNDCMYILDTSKENSFLLQYGTNNGFVHSDTEILSVHQLQNLYFALTGKELEVKL